MILLSLEQEASVTLSEEKQAWKTISLCPLSSFLSIFGPLIAHTPTVLSSDAVAKISLLSREKQQWSTPPMCFRAFWSTEPDAGSHRTTLPSFPAVFICILVRRNIIFFAAAYMISKDLIQGRSWQQWHHQCAVPVGGVLAWNSWYSRWWPYGRRSLLPATSSPGWMRSTRRYCRAQLALAGGLQRMASWMKIHPCLLWVTPDWTTPPTRKHTHRLTSPTHIFEHARMHQLHMHARV